MEQWRYDLRHALRVLRQGRGFTLTAILSLAIGLGAAAALFSVTSALLLRPLGFSDSGRIAIIWQRSPGLHITQDWLSLGQYLDIKGDSAVFEQVAAAIGASVNLTGEGGPERVDGARVSSSLFPVLGVTPRLGRVFTPAEDVPGAPPAVILTHGFWQRRFGGDSEVVGKTLTLNGNPWTVVGVLPRNFPFDREVLPAVNGIRSVDFLIPLPLPPSARSKRDGEDFNLYARLRPGVTFAQAQAAMDRRAAEMKRDYPASYPPHGGLTLSVVPLIDQVVGDVRLPLAILLGAVACLLLIACGNVANLLLSRAAIRQKEMAIRAAVGASRGRLLRQLLGESVLLSVVGGGLGLLLATGAIALLQRAGPATLPRMGEIGIDLRVMGFTVAVTLLTGVLCGVVPALRFSQADPNDVLKEGGRGGVGNSAFGLGHDRLRKLLIGSAVALSLVLLIGAGLLVRSYGRILGANPGFDPRGVLTFRIALPGFRYKTPEAVTQFYRSLDERLRALPGVAHVGANYLLPLSSVALGWEPIGVEGYQPPAAGDDLIIASSGYVNEDYFGAMGIPLRKGRFFSRQDTPDAPGVTIVDDKLADRFWPGQDPLGKRIRRGADGPWLTVVGVVADQREFETTSEPPITAYFPLEQVPVPIRYLAVRSARDPAALAAQVTREVHALDADLPVFDIATMEDRLADSLARRRLAMQLLVGFAGVALVLAAIGIYGVTSYWTGQRTREIGIRMAMGADAGAIRGMVLGQALRPVLGGVVAGLAGAFALSRVMSSLLFGVSATDALSFGLLPLALAAVALLASDGPARRAARTDPMVAVRAE
ncbi:MAG: ABC transporter permease [Gemmatimonadales bacterium]